MLKEILVENLHIVFVGTAVAEISDELGFYFLGPKDRFWDMMEYAGISPTVILSKSDRKALVDAKRTGALNDVYKQFFFEKKESMLLKSRIGITHLNRRQVVSVDDESSAEPTQDDVQKFVKKIEKFQPMVIAFVTSPDIFEKCFKPLYPLANQQRGKQDFLIGTSEVWLLGGMNVRRKEVQELEQVIDDLMDRLKTLDKAVR